MLELTIIINTVKPLYKGNLYIKDLMYKENLYIKDLHNYKGNLYIKDLHIKET